MSPWVRRIQLLYLAFACLAASLHPVESTAEIKSEDILENEWFEFQCDYNSTNDKSGFQEVGVTVQECSKEITMASDPENFNLIAAVFGRMSYLSDNMRQKYFQDNSPPLYYANHENVYVKDNLVEVIYGNVGSIRIKIKATTKMDRLCAFCAQTAGGFQYSLTKKVSLKIRKSPTLTLTLNDKAVTTGSRLEHPLNQLVKIVCTADGPDTLTITLFKNGQILSTETGGSLTHEIASTVRESSGNYKCEVSTDYPPLVEKNMHTARVEFVMAIRFPPQFDLSEVVRYTKLSSKEEIKISVSAYPQPELKCEPAQSDDLTTLESYDENAFVGIYKLILSNLDQVKNQTEFQCTANNTVGDKKLGILLTAKAPKPQILSDARTDWHNSYQLRWQHHKNANIDFYQVEIAYLSGEDLINKTTTRFDPTAQKGHMALVDTKHKSDQIEHSGVLFGLNADSGHDIRLQSCNQHGCSEFSDSINVNTPKASPGSFNDPENPEKKTGSNQAMRGSLTVSAICTAGALLLVKHQYWL